MIRENADSNPLVSVLMTAYNREKYIGEAIESVINSTYQNWELIIVDDCSTDSTVDIARRYAATHQRIKVYINEKNLGDYPNRNRAANYAKGKYLKYVDADDMILPEGLETWVDLMEKYPDAGICLSKNRTPKEEQFLPSYEAIRFNFLTKSILDNAPLSVIIRTSTFHRAGGFNHYRHFGDEDMWIRVAKFSGVLIIDKYYSWWRAHDQQEAFFRKNKTGLVVDQTQMIIDHINDPVVPLSDIERKTAIEKQKIGLVHTAIKHLLSGKLRAAFEIIGSFKLAPVHFIKAFLSFAKSKKYLKANSVN
jgi:glycosyltransferase involved in cell wall biosynthesis